MRRYIDADRLKEQIPKDIHEDVFENCSNCELLDDEQVKELIDLQPTADVRENVRGEWISHDLENGEKSIDKDCCSVCGERFREIAMTGCEWNFCPNCGADMRREDNGRDEENHNRV